MLILKEVDPLPAVCRQCKEKGKLYAAVSEEEKLRTEQDEGFFFACGCFEFGAVRFYLSETRCTYPPLHPRCLLL